MINIKIDIPATFSKSTDNEVSLSRGILSALVERYNEIYQGNVSSELNTTEQQYIDAIEVEFESDYIASVYLRDDAWLPKALEEGASSFDMKEQLLKNSDSKGGKNIPIGFGSSTNDGSSRPNFYKKNTMPSAVYNAAKKLQGNKRLTSDQVPDVRVNPSNQGSIYSGMKREQDTTGSTSQYKTFRRVSNNSDPDAWQHPGLEAHDFIGKSINEFMTEKDDIVDLFIKGYFS